MLLRLTDLRHHYGKRYTLFEFDVFWHQKYNFNKPKFYLRYVDTILAVFDNGQDSFFFLDFLNNRYPNIKFLIQKQVNHSIAFLDVFISGINNQNLTLQTYHKST